MSFHSEGKATKTEMVARAAACLDCDASDIRLFVPWKDTPNNTLIFGTRDGIIKHILFHRTLIARGGEGKWEISIDGHNTVTTRQRLNALTPFRLHTQKGVLYIDGRPMVDDAIVTGSTEDGWTYETPGVDQQEADWAMVERFIDKYVRRAAPLTGKGDPIFPSQWHNHINRDTIVVWLRTGYFTKWLVEASMFAAKRTPDMVGLAVQKYMRDGCPDNMIIRDIRKYCRAALAR